MFFKHIIIFITALLSASFNTEPSFLNIEGLVTVDGQPVRARIEVNSIQKHVSFPVKSHTDKISGSFTAKLPAGDEYEIVVHVDRFPQQVISLNTLELDSSGTLNVYADFTSPEYDKKLEALILSTEPALFIKSRFFDRKSFGKNFGNTKKEQLEYKVQIAAYKFFENFNYNNVLGFPTIIRKIENDHITRFTMGNFETYNEALTLQEKLQRNELKDAFVIGVYKGERKTVQQLTEEGIVQ